MQNTAKSAVKPEKKRIRLKYIINYLIVGIFFLVFLTMDLTGGLRTSTTQLLTKISYSIVLAVSLNLVVGFLGELSLGHAGFMCVGAFIGGLCANYLHASIGSPLVVLIITLVIGGITAAVAGLLIGLPTLRLKGDYLAITTLAFGEIVRTIFKNQEIFGGATGLTVKRYSGSLWIVGFVLVFVTLFVTQNLKRSKHGRAIEAIRDNEIAARAMGINITYYKLMVFIIAAFFAGMAGVIYGHSVTPISDGFFSFNYSIEILVMVVLGGMGNITGSILAAALLTLINVKLTVHLSGDLAALKFLIYAIILIAVVIWNNAPALRPVRERFNLHNLVEFLRRKLFPHKENETDVPDTARWDTVPTKIPMDAILSTDFKLDQTFEADKPQKGGNDQKG